MTDTISCSVVKRDHLEQALGAEQHKLCHIPFTAEDVVLELLREGR